MAQRLAVKQMTRAQAQAITAEINDATTALWELIHQARTGRVWLALGYTSWEAYVQAEVTIGRTEAYNLLVQGEVIHALAGAAALPSSALDVSMRAANEIKGSLPSVTKTLADAVKGKPRASRPAIVADVLGRARRERAVARRAEQDRLAREEALRQSVKAAAIPATAVDGTRLAPPKVDPLVAENAKLKLRVHALEMEVADLRHQLKAAKAELVVLGADRKPQRSAGRVNGSAGRAAVTVAGDGCGHEVTEQVKASFGTMVVCKSCKQRWPSDQWRRMQSNGKVLA